MSWIVHVDAAACGDRQWHGPRYFSPEGQSHLSNLLPLMPPCRRLDSLNHKPSSSSYILLDDEDLLSLYDANSLKWPIDSLGVISSHGFGYSVREGELMSLKKS